MAALDQMLQSTVFESGVRRIGAEQELFLIDREMRPSPVGEKIVDLFQDRRCSNELAKFNLEINATPQIFTGSSLHDLHSELEKLLEAIRDAAGQLDSKVLLTGILPTLRPSDLSPQNMTNLPRYHELDDSLREQRGSDFLVHIKGIDELVFSHHTMMMEACNTSFQIHYQVDPATFADVYNFAQAISAPLLAAGANSPLLFRKRLWNETRLALIQHSTDERNKMETQRLRPTRATFGEDWVHESVLEIYKENVSRFRPLLMVDLTEDSLLALSTGNIPKLQALCLHNSTVWRWNRPCYGIIDGRPHLRIENRVLPAGPTVVDEIANAAFFCGMLSGMEKHCRPIHNSIAFHQAQENFFSAARHGLNAQFFWSNQSCYTARDLILNDLLPLAHEGLKCREIQETDRNHYLGIIEERVRSGMTGARWIFDSWNHMRQELLPESCSRAITENMLAQQDAGKPVHQWEPSQPPPSVWKAENYRYVGQIMSTDLFTIRPEDLVHLAACIMDWQHVRHLPVEDRDGYLAGLLTQRDLMQFFSRFGSDEMVPVQMIMKTNPITVAPDTLTLSAMELMRTNTIGCLPVVENGRLVGIITTLDLLHLSSRLLKDELGQTS